VLCEVTIVRVLKTWRKNGINSDSYSLLPVVYLVLAAKPRGFLFSGCILNKVLCKLTQKTGKLTVYYLVIPESNLSKAVYL